MSKITAPAPNFSAIQQAEERLQILLPGIYRDRTEEVQPVSMGSAPLAFDLDGNVAWDRMWGSFCDLAMAGGPPHKGMLLEPGTPDSILAESIRYAEVCDEIVRGISLAARLQAVPAASAGWVRVLCKNPTMAQWMLRAITMENVSARVEESAVLLPAGPLFRLEKEIKNVITVIAKTSHYWSSHLIRLQQLGVANLFAELESEAQLLEPTWTPGKLANSLRERVQNTLENATGLPATHHGYVNWIGLDCGNVSSAIATMRRLVASNILSRREETAVFLPLNPTSDPGGERIARMTAELLARST